jgi:N-acyl-D-aspartate/D-glutamate deacylase
MSWDLVIRGGHVVDGTGMRGFTADVAIADGRIARVGRVEESATREIDADGCWVTPGFIDVHTHYDVQLDWDPLATPSCWHGVTSVLAGNCGFTLAPAKPEDVEWLAGMLSRVEGMSRAALGAGLRFRGGSFGDYWKRFEGALGINVGSYVGHCAVRRFVMGDDASERTATPEEIAAMKELVRQSMREGALGFSTSQIEVHVGEDGRASARATTRRTASSSSISTASPGGPSSSTSWCRTPSTPWAGSPRWSSATRPSTRGCGSIPSSPPTTWSCISSWRTPSCSTRCPRGEPH